MSQVTATSLATPSVIERAGKKVRTPQAGEKLSGKITDGGLIHPGLNKFFKLVNGYTEGEDSNFTKHNYFSLRDLTKSAWFMYLPLQAIGLISEKATKYARAWYGGCWSIVYSCYRPWKANVKKLADKDPANKISDLTKKADNLNEHFRMIMGSAVSAIYGSGAFGMLFGAFTDNDDLFEKSSNVYQTGMFNQNQVFASMNFSTWLKRILIKEGKLDDKALDDVDKHSNNEDKNSRWIKNIKENVEVVDSVLFLPNILTRGLDTLKLFGLNVMSESVERFVNCLGYFSYGTWAARFGIMKTREEKGGDLANVKDSNQTLYDLQKVGGKAFYSTLPILSWISAGSELFGLSDFAQKTFKLEGVLERLNPTIFAWCLTDPWLKGYFKRIKGNKKEIESV